MDENEISRIVVDSAYQIHRQLGPGLLESVYEVILSKSLTQRGLTVERQKPIPIEWEGCQFNEGFRADLVVNNKIIIELKSVEKVPPVSAKQLLTYLRLTGMHLGILINFGAPLIKDGIHRVANQMPE
jgi:GxxExxY protein